MLPHHSQREIESQSCQTLQNGFQHFSRLIDSPYPNECEQFAGWMHSAELETHLLATPRRKTALIMDRTGDYENDENMTQDSELTIEQEIESCFALLCQRMTEVYGAAIDLEVDDSSLQARIEPEDEDDDDALTESYLSGAHYDNCDDQEASFWRLGSDYVCIQKLKKWGDGDFKYYVIATVTPCEAN